MRQRKIDRQTQKAVRRFLSLIKDKCDVVRAIVFGSRARGDFRPDSDADVALLLKDPQQRTWDLRDELSNMAFDVLLETRIRIQATLISEQEWVHPEIHSNPDLLKDIARDGINVRLAEPSSPRRRGHNPQYKTSTYNCNLGIIY